MKNPYKCSAFNLLEAENRIREVAMGEMLTPPYYESKDTPSDKYAQAVPYYNDGVLNMAEALINALKEEAEANEDDAMD